jgi:predicted RNA methylase
MKNIEEVKAIINTLYADIEGYKLYTQAKVKNNKEYKDLIYGEIPITILNDIFSETECKDGVFYDLGSGTGKLVLAAHMLGNFSKCVGIELLGDLHKVAVEKQIEYEKSIEDKEKGKIEFIKGDFLEQNLNDANLIVVGLPSQNADVMDALEKKIESLRSGIKIVTIIGFLKTDEVMEIKSKKYNFPWGKSTAYFYEKR